VIDEVTTSLALRTKMRSETVGTSEHTKIGVCSTLSHIDNERFIRILAAKVHQAMTLQHSYLFALIPNPVGGPLDMASTLIFCGSPQHLVTKACILAGLRFKTRLAELQDTTGTWIGHLEPHVVGDEILSSHVDDEDVLWDIVRKAANPIDPTDPPPGSRGIDQLLIDARARLDRLTPSEAFKEAVEDGILVDIRTEAQRAEHGGIPGSVIIDRNVLEWRFDPRSLDGRLPIADRYDLRVIVYCQVSNICFSTLIQRSMFVTGRVHEQFSSGVIAGHWVMASNRY
jgi:rhodanese-related sulfurtransferase